MTRNIFVLLTGYSLLATAPLAAQERSAWPQRIFVTVDVPVQPLNNDFSESVSFADTVRRTENVTFVTGYESTRGALIDAGAGVRLARNIGVGVTTSWFQRSSAGSFDLKVPNPIVANKPLDLPGTVSGLKRNELGIHIQGLYAIAIAKRTQLMLSGGPSVFKTKQDLVRSIEFDTLPGFAALAFDQAIVTESQRTVVGFNAGADVTWALTPRLGVGSVTRYTRATVTFDPGSATGVSRAIELHAGGLQVGGGIRLLF
jgi:hypothetical protein